MSRRATPPLARDAAATLALAVYSGTIAFGFSGVFSGWDFLADLAVYALVIHLLSFVLRRLHVSGWIAIPLLALVGAWLISAMYYRDTLSWWMPWSATWDQVALELELVRDQFPTAVPPVLYGAGWAPLSAFALVLIAVMSDSFAFRADARGEALVPGGVLFVFVTALGDGRLEVVSTVLLIGAGVLVVIAQRALHDRTRTTVLSARTRTVHLTVPAAVASAVCIAVVAGVIGPNMPGARADGLVDWKGDNGTTLIDSPFVDIRSRLTNLGNVELFRVNADRPEYWRLITLAEFDGERFTLPERPLDDVGETPLASDDARRVRQQIQILSLTGELVPAAPDPVQASLTRASGERLGLRQQPDSSTLISPVELAPGDVFDIVSVAPSPTADDLRGAGAGAPPDPVYLELPDDLPDIVYERTTALTSGATSPFDAALAIQNWFRDPAEFSYSLEAQSGHGSNAIEVFFSNRAGYCEQFAASFAAMARAAGIPSRVAVGYTPGLADPDEPGWYSVIGKNAHAWPELWFEGVGWVMFEPTPGRGSASAEAYTGIPAQQDDTGPTAAGGDVGGSGLVPQVTTPPTLVDGGSGAPATTVAPLSDGADDFPGSDLVPQNNDNFLGDIDEPGVPSDTDDGFGGTRLLLVFFVVAALFAPKLVRRLQRARRRVHGGDDQITAAWERALSVAGDAGVAGSASMTPTEWTAATAELLPVAARPMGSLAHVVDQVMYAEPGSVDFDSKGSIGDRLGDDCDLWSEQIEMVANDTLSATKRVKRYFAVYR
jgi:transglutaminase-like putative cysteine protease